MTKLSTLSAVILLVLTSACGMSTMEAEKAKNPASPSAPPALVEDNDAGVEPQGDENDDAVVAPVTPAPTADAGTPVETPVVTPVVPTTPVATPVHASAFQVEGMLSGGETCFSLATEYNNGSKCAIVKVFGGNWTNFFVSDADTTTGKLDGRMGTCFKVTDGSYRITYVAADCSTKNEITPTAWATYGTNASAINAQPEAGQQFLNCDSNGCAITFDAKNGALNGTGNQ